MTKNTNLCVDLKTFLQNDVLLKLGKDYRGVLNRDSEDHYTFVESVVASSAGKRNPQVYEGTYITITRKDDGSYRPNFKPLKETADFDVNEYAVGVARELHEALGSLIGK